MTEEVREQWVMKFDGSFTTHSGGVGVVLYHEEDKAVALSFKLEFPCSNNTVEYEAYLTACHGARNGSQTFESTGRFELGRLPGQRKFFLKGA